MSKKPKVTQNDVVAAQTQVGDEGIEAKHYAPPTKDAENPLTQFDYSRLRGEQYQKYFELVEGKVNPRSLKSHSMPERTGGLNRNKQYIFNKYKAVPIKETPREGYTEITGLQLLSTIPENVGIRMALTHAITLNHQLGQATQQYPCMVYLLEQTHDLT
jgi:hypothetical protein